MSTVSWNEGKSRFGPSSFLRKIVGVSYLCKFYFEINSKTGTNIEDLFDNSGTQTNAPGAEKISLRDAFFYSQSITIPSRGITTDTYSYSNGSGWDVGVTNSTNNGTDKDQLLTSTLVIYHVNASDALHDANLSMGSIHGDLA